VMRQFRRRKRRTDAPGATSGPGPPSRARGGAARLRFEVSEDARSARLALHGEFDIDSADSATRALDELLGRDLDAVVVDLSGLDFMDSTGVKFLVDARETAHDLGVKLSVVHGGDPVRRVLTVSGVTALFDDQNKQRAE
jgi:anti-sigma B factor antagonist